MDFWGLPEGQYGGGVGLLLPSDFPNCLGFYCCHLAIPSELNNKSQVGSACASVLKECSSLKRYRSTCVS